MDSEEHISTVQRILVNLGQMGEVLHTEISRNLGPDLSSNAAVATLFSLDLDGPMRPGQIQDLTGLSSGGVTKLLDRMESAGLIVREFGVLPEDRRASVVRLTTKGHGVSTKMAEDLFAVMGEVRVKLKEIDTLLG